MKKTLIFAILAGAALVGCVKNEEVAKGSDGSPELIAFDAPVVGVPTRATEIYGNYPGGKDFAVWALYHEKTYDASAFNSPVYYMSDVTCNADNSANPTTWKPATDYYWPKVGYLTFAAYAPSEVSAAWNVNGFKFTDFTLKEDPANQIDLLYSERVYNKQSGDMLTADNKAPYQGITIPFKHALSSILFTVETTGIDASSNTVITLTGLQVNNVVKKGTFAQNLLADVSGDNDANKPAWTVNATVADNVKSFYTVFPKSGATEAERTKVITGTRAYVNGDPDGAGETYDTTVDGEIPQDPASTNDGLRRSDLIVIPQSLNRGNADSDKVTVTISYTIKNGTNAALSQSQTFQLAVGDQNEDGNAEFEWEMGKRYTYHIVIGMNKIYFNPQVTNWDDVPTELI